MIEGDGADVVDGVVDGVEGVVVMRRCSGKVPRRQIVVEALQGVGSLEIAHRWVHHF